MSARLTTAEIVQATGGRLLSGAALTMIDGVCTDPRTATPGCLFVSLAGSDLSVDDAFRRGAIGACVTDSGDAGARMQQQHPRKLLVAVADTRTALGDLACFWRHRRRLRVIAIIGADCTAVKELAWQVIEKPCAAYKNQSPPADPIDLALDLLQLEAHNRTAVLELGNGEAEHSPQLAAICDPEITVITGTTAKNRAACAAVLSAMAETGTAVLPAADRRAASLAARARCRTMTFGMRAADLSGLLDKAAGTLAITLPGTAAPQHLHPPQGYSTAQVLASAAVAHVCGLTAADIKAALEN